MKLSFYQRHQTRKAIALLILFAFLLVPMTAAAGEPKPCPSGGGEDGCCPDWCYCNTHCDTNTAVSDVAEAAVGELVPPGVGLIVEIAKAIYNNWDDIVDFFTGDSDSGSCSN